MQKIELKVAETVAKLQVLGYNPIKITSVLETLPKGCAGQANTCLNKVSISSDYWEQYEEQLLARTVPHEVVHLYVAKYFPKAKQAHGKEFRMLMQQLGCDTSTYHTMKLDGMEKRKNKVLRFIYETPTGKICHLTRIQHARMMAGTHSFTMKGETLKFTNKEIRI